MKKALSCFLALTVVGLSFFGCSKGSSDNPVASPPDTQPPVVNIAQPIGGSVLTGFVSIGVNAVDNGGMSKVEIYANNKIVGVCFSSPWTYSWNTTTVADGNYSLVAWGYDGAGNVGYSAPINVTLSNPYQVSFRNTVFTDITVTIAGQSAQNIRPNATVAFSIPGSTSSLSYFATTSGTTNVGSQVGLKVTWNNPVDLSAGKNISIDLAINPQIFFLYITNSGLRNLTSVYVNYGLVSQTIDNIVIPPDGQKYTVGYYYAYTNTQVRAYIANTTASSYWTQGTHFTFPFTPNQSLSLLNTYSGIQVDDGATTFDPLALARAAVDPRLMRQAQAGTEAKIFEHYGHPKE